MFVVLYAVMPCLLMPITMVLTIVVALLIPLRIVAVMDRLAIVDYAA
jgi:hypothetical protein